MATHDLAVTSGGPSTTAQRLSTNARTLGELVLRAGSKHVGAAMWRPVPGGRAEISYGDLERSARGIARGLIGMGLEPGERVSILAMTRPEWVVADLGAFCAGAVVAPIYHTNSPEECAYVLSHADARVVFCEDADQVAKVAGVRDQCPALRQVVVLEGVAEGAPRSAGVRVRGVRRANALAERSG